MDTKLCPICNTIRPTDMFLQDDRCRLCECKTFTKRQLYFKRYYQENKELYRQRRAQRRIDHREHMTNMERQYCNRRYHSDPVFRQKIIVRATILNVIKRQRVNKSAAKFLGCDYLTYITHLHNTFLQRYSRLPTPEDKVEVDHIIALNNALSVEDVLKLSHYTNTQLLLAIDNRNKHRNSIK